ncbi:DUF4124 domain-containing protein [Pseudoxanthomonas sp. F37]|uniref:DUF4124 domain-containing protein n=1 Tax=Pseudoxanthomonas TaxID=83618 RepID=UPI001FCFB558|nr:MULTISPECIES: DUF4124 domain-containing protein [Pseudoxanthomonas]UOV03523.1 DUF4124 domain-containing protein [Pseudoxanthomonas mexicana]UOV08505.1 DUF4124 domain-containing protein [Pseudoxanthomonas sp. F37]
MSRIPASYARRLALAIVLGAAIAPASRAGDVVIYRCTDASGALTLQNAPCPKGMKQEQRTLPGVNTVPMAPASPAAPPAAAQRPPATPSSPTTREPAPAAPAADAPRLPPPVLFQCTTYDKDTYVTEDSEPASRCVALRTTGLDGNPQGGAGQACEVVRDTCARVPDGALCDAWRKRRDETEVAWRFARRENVERNRAEYQRVARILSESDCGE